MLPETIALAPHDAALESAFAAELSRLIGERQFQRWFQNRTAISTVDDELILGVGSPFLLKWMQKQFRPAILRAAQIALGPAARVRFEVDPRVTLTERAAEDVAVVQKNDVAAKPANSQQPARSAERSTPHVPRTGRHFSELSDFVGGTCNELALTAAAQVAHAPAQKVNPLYIYGPVGTGKTHLLEGIYRQTRRNFPALQVVFLSSEGFANYFTQALRDHTLPGFRQRFRTVDVLIVDDIDFLDGKKGIQEEFLHTYKQLESLGRQIVLAGDRHPRLLAKSSDELKTRFLAGMVCRLEAPDAETREKIVARKAARLDADFSPEALAFVAQRFTNNVRELEGALHCLRTYHSMTGKRVTATAARQVLAELERDCIKVVKLADIDRVVCELFGLDSDELKSARRTQSLSRPRMLAMFLARKHTRAAYSEIGHYFGGRNHSTVISAERKIHDGLNAEEPIKVSTETWRLSDVVIALEQQLQAG